MNSKRSHSETTIKTQPYLDPTGRSIRRPPSNPKRRDVRPQRVGHSGDGTRPRVVWGHRADGVRRQRGHILRHRPYAHARAGP